ARAPCSCARNSSDRLPIRFAPPTVARGVPGSLVGDVVVDPEGRRMNTPKRFPPPEHLRAAFRVSVVSVAWTVSASAIAIVSGIVARALVLVVFGLTGVLDAAGSWTLALHFRHAIKHETVSLAREELAL